MQTIQWFPGHMTKALRMMEENIKLVDGVLFVVDARAPFACFNKKMNSVFNGKPVLYLINKSDLISEADKRSVSSGFASLSMRHTFTSAIDFKYGKSVYNAIIDMFSEKIKAKKEKGINKILRLMVCGVPNTGKSAVINCLAKKRQAATGDKAGVTRGKQWIKLEDIELLDTPGTMPPSFDNQTYAHHLAYIGAINDDILDFEELCLDFIEELRNARPGVLSSRYGVDEGMLPIEIFNSICSSRGFLSKGGDYDYLRCAKAVVDDFRKGRLGQICLENRL